MFNRLKTFAVQLVRVIGVAFIFSGLCGLYAECGRTV